MNAPLKTRYNTTVQFPSMEVYFRLKNLAKKTDRAIGSVIEDMIVQEEKKKGIQFDSNEFQQESQR